MARMIPLTKGQFALVSECDYARVSRFKWYAHWNPTAQAFYAARTVKPKNGLNKMIWMHRFVKNADPKDRRIVDHKIRAQTLNNTRSNLRFATKAQNAQNGRRKLNSSGYKGVTWHRAARLWMAQIESLSKSFYLGLFRSRIQAARAYDRAARKLHGRFATLNFPRRGERGAR